MKLNVLLLISHFLGWTRILYLSGEPVNLRSIWLSGFHLTHMSFHHVYRTQAWVKSWGNFPACSFWVMSCASFSPTISYFPIPVFSLQLPSSFYFQHSSWCMVLLCLVSPIVFKGSQIYPWSISVWTWVPVKGLVFFQKMA